jgi:hypothetical protein
MARTLTSKSRPSQRRDPGFILLKKIRRGRVFVKDAGLVLLNPGPDQVSTDVVVLGGPMQGLAGQEFLSDLALEFDAVGGGAWPWASILRKPGSIVNSCWSNRPAARGSRPFR